MNITRFLKILKILKSCSENLIYINKTKLRYALIFTEILTYLEKHSFCIRCVICSKWILKLLNY